MQIGKYRITVTRTTEVQITVADEALFLYDYTAWKNMYGDSADDVTEEDFLAARAIMSVAGGNGGKYSRGITITPADRQYIETNYDVQVDTCSVAETFEFLIISEKQ